ncbi:MAG: ribosome biogenesis GTPase Der [Deltaproteobacteria bacterium RIFCSPLOWO2_12_FULL_44_12]|nr:MAG: ribosome biogenesis GTPase Der [Deltaproteobacteria bacterium RIFCSPHIGHO2_01_FULL_43_49]OGQ15578.1 MAG: ribosome biogenesis GTPase Der [Deltaproteobacteria bacterium RIFCSPHIGHO2_02_FULL_44_53]OGQ28511.1 MAG: ribosome biogenesis GTPase Der [Deltaproteobacteria bacterium RIFCSPHIGHO2_12_FULL_44_21]OGQ32385.1 MAG: ribosome biogenesis GTPase Der [Deltaproteobacteria bacterium RIFCSPLOWO2_01_FULL_45_74]OGQ44027.1 MAG: ribosome biogenesis GTPase Der [Deltaproteobacteria bacterium RIFCSPLOWO
MSLPIIAIVGRPNVGKSRLFNRLVGKYRALVDDQPGVTRDRHYGLADWRGRSFVVVDTGGLIPGAEEPLDQKVWGQAFQAIQEADLIICLMDGFEGLTPLDQALVENLRKIKKPCFYTINKIDSSSRETGYLEFSKLGLDPIFSISAEHGRGISELLEALYEKLPVVKEGTEVPVEKVLRLAIVGRPNVGKSTLINQLVGQERVVVHEEAGTTRDAIDVLLERDGKKLILVDTAGIKKKSATKTRLEKFSVLKSLKAIDESNLVCFLLDATQGVTHQDLQLAHIVWEARKGLLILVNKWDMMKTTLKQYEKDLRPQLRDLQKVPIVFISAETGFGTERIWDAIFEINAAMQKKMTTAKLNQWLEKVMMDHPLPMHKGKSVKFFYGTQVASAPPHFIFFANAPEGIPDSYRRYMIHQLEDALDVEGIPIGITFKKKSSKR